VKMEVSFSRGETLKGEIMLRSQEVDLVFYYFLFLFSFLFIELRVRIDGHRLQDIEKEVEGPQRGDIIQHIYHMLASCLTHSHLG